MLRRSIRISALFSFFVICLSSVLQGQEYIADIQHFGIEEGLSHRDVHCVIQDSRGFIWIGTNYGLNRFDGLNFQVFTKEKNGLGNNQIHHLLEDADGWLWIFKGQNYISKSNFIEISFLNVQTLAIKTWAERFGTSAPITQDQIHTAISNPEGTIYLGTKDGRLTQFNPGTGWKTHPVKTAHALSLAYYSKDHTIFARYIDFTAHLNIELGTLIELDTTGTILWRDEENINFRPIAQAEDGHKWYWNGGNDGAGNIRLYTGKGKEALEPFDTGDAPIPNAWKNNRSQTAFYMYYHRGDPAFWYHNFDNFWVFYPDKKMLFDFGKEHAEIINNQIHHIYFDNQNNAWVSTANGIDKIQLRPSPFRKYLSLSPKEYTINEGFSARGMLVQDQQLYVNSVTNIQYKIDLTDGQQEQLKPVILNNANNNTLIDEAIFQPIIARDESELMFGGIVYSLYHPKEDRHQLIYWDEVDYRNIAWSLFCDSQQRYWAGLHSLGLGYWDQQIDRFKLFSDYNAYEELRSSSVYSFLEWNEEHLLIASSSGIYVLHQEKGIIDQFDLSHDLIYHLHKDKQSPNIIWASTGGGGIIQIQLKADRQSPQVLEHTPITIADGLSSNVIYAVYEDEQNNLWMPSDYGIIRFNKDINSAEVFLEPAGISHHEFNRVAHFQEENGTLYFGGLNGVTAFHPEDIVDKTEEYEVPLEILSFQQYDDDSNNMVDRTRALEEQSSISLYPGDRFFTLNFALLEYQDAKQIRYRYKMEGQNNDWVLLDGNSLRISGLPYGDYVLRIKGRGVNGQFSSSELSIPIQVFKPIYLQNWFFILSALTLLFVAFVFYQWRTQKLIDKQKTLEESILEATLTIRQRNEQLEADKQIIQKQAEELKQMDKVKSQFFANVSHELRTPLTLMLGPVKSVLKANRIGPEDFAFLKLAQKNGNNLIRLVNEILSLIKLENNKLILEEKPTALYAFLSRIVASFESHAEREGLEFEFHYQPAAYLQVQLDEDKLEKILNNLLSNAIKFTPAGGKIIFSIKELPNRIQINVADTGQGILEENLPYIFDRFYQTQAPDATVSGGMGIGLALSREFTKLMNGQLWAESILGEGSTFYLEIPKKEVLGSRVEQSLPTIEPEIALPETISMPQLTADHTLLVVEDNRNMAQYIQMILSEQWKVIIAGNGQMAIECLLSGAQPDLIISDLMMPVMDGYQLLEYLKESNRFRHLPVVMLTARAAPEDKLRALRIGVDDYLIKPFDAEELKARVKNILANAQRRSEVRIGEEEPVILEQSNISKVDLQWLEELENTVCEKIGDFRFSVESLASDKAMSRSQLYRRIKRLTGLTANQYLNEVRFNQARYLLQDGLKNSVKAVAYEVGLKDVANFSRQFKKRFGKLPSDFLS